MFNPYPGLQVRGLKSSKNLSPKIGSSLYLWPTVFSATLSSLSGYLGELEERLFGLRDYHSNITLFVEWSFVPREGRRFLIEDDCIQGVTKLVNCAEAEQ